MSYERINIMTPQCRLPCSYYFKGRMDRTLRGEKIWVDPGDPRRSCHSFVLSDREYRILKAVNAFKNDRMSRTKAAAQLKFPS